MAFLAAFALPLCRAWLGERPDLAVLPLTMMLSAASAHLHIVTGPASAVFRSQGNVANEFACHGLRIVGIAAGVGLAAQCMGLTVTAVACGLAGGIATAAVAYLVHSYRALRIPLPLLATRVPLPGLVPAALAAALAGPEGMTASRDRARSFATSFRSRHIRLRGVRFNARPQPT